MTFGKRALDLLLALVLLVPAVPVMAVIALLVLCLDGRPVFYASERMRAPGRPFTLWKFRTMRPDSGDSGVSGGDKAGRITRTGRVLRRMRLDELPQLWNVLAGDMSFIGPRPPLREYVERFPQLYARVLRSRPGISGLATLQFHRHEERLLARARTRQETDAIYCRACIPRKARLDLIYQRRRNLCLDLLLIARTARRAIR
ncbi:sugar transferase [Pararhodobacter sp. SW119]|uniref:sugar transferase n=1 Tax=Pararhodobacter sp. SW119 TaxID=2780075 RepID=UPI001AE074A4|nr:sugar transferase [Pararhodobacter sp. SW119]